MIVDAGKLKAAIKQAVEEINDAALDLRDDGITVLMPEFIDFEVSLVTDLNAVNRTETRTEDNGTTTTTTSQSTPDTQTRVTSGGDTQTRRLPTGGTETTTITHPSIITTGSGADNSDETVTYEYED